MSLDVDCSESDSDNGDGEGSEPASGQRSFFMCADGKAGRIYVMSKGGCLHLFDLADRSWHCSSSCVKDLSTEGVRVLAMCLDGRGGVRVLVRVGASDVQVVRVPLPI